MSTALLIKYVIPALFQPSEPDHVRLKDIKLIFLVLKPPNLPASQLESLNTGPS
jgi:hypothetical protein